MIANICPHCGNPLQSWMHSTCYNCLRNAQEFKRYGRRSAKRTNQISAILETLVALGQAGEKSGKHVAG